MSRSSRHKTNQKQNTHVTKQETKKYTNSLNSYLQVFLFRWYDWLTDWSLLNNEHVTNVHETACQKINPEN